MRITHLISLLLTGRRNSYLKVASVSCGTSAANCLSAAKCWRDAPGYGMAGEMSVKDSDKRDYISSDLEHLLLQHLPRGFFLPPAFHLPALAAGVGLLFAGAPKSTR